MMITEISNFIYFIYKIHFADTFKDCPNLVYFKPIIVDLTYIVVVYFTSHESDVHIL